MAINDLPVLSALRTKMQWHQERQRVLAENISNSDTPNFRPRDLVEPKFDRNGSSALPCTISPSRINSPNFLFNSATPLLESFLHIRNTNLSPTQRTEW